jgi:RNA polymerase sigma factor (sigma-70 family)
MSDESRIPPFQVFFEAHRALVYRFLMASVGPNDVEDCFQETFLSALRAYPNLRDAANLRGWVLQIAANKAVDAGRAKGRRPAAMAEVPEGPAAFDPTGRAWPGDPGSGLGLGFDTREPLWSAVRTLPEKMRTAVVLRHVLDRPYEDVAAAMGGTEDAARANVHQGLKRLRASLGDPMVLVGEE